jgi:hypothetical protein
MCPRKLARRSAFFALLPLALSGCGGASFDDPSIIKGLRILAVEKSEPYPKQDQDVLVKLLFWDAKSTEANPRNVHIYFSGEVCVNPLGDLYYNCLNQPSSVPSVEGTPDGSNPDLIADGGTTDADVPDADLSDGGVSDGGVPLIDPQALSRTPGFVPITAANFPRHRSLTASDFVRATEMSTTGETSRLGDVMGADDVDHIRGRTYRIPGGIVHPKMSGDPYGLVYVLFAACPGHLGIVPNAGANAVPFGCFDDVDNHQYGVDDFVFGYTSMYVYENRVNNNPIANALLFEKMSLEGSTTDDTLARHVPVCKASDRTQCPAFPIRLDIVGPPAEIDDDPNAVTPEGQKLQEQMWVTFYTTAGNFKSSQRLVNDATKGWNDDNGTDYYAPAEPGPVRLFAVVHDNRGGVAWREGTIIADD